MSLHLQAQSYANKAVLEKADTRLQKLNNPSWTVDEWEKFWRIEIKRQDNDFNKAYREFLNSFNEHKSIHR